MKAVTVAGQGGREMHRGAASCPIRGQGQGEVRGRGAGGGAVNRADLLRGAASDLPAAGRARGHAGPEAARRRGAGR